MADGDLISRASLLAGIAELKESPWYNFGKVEGTSPEGVEAIWHYGYLQRKEAVEIIEEMCIEKEPAVLADSGWISVKDKLPAVTVDTQTSKIVMCFSRDNEYEFFFDVYNALSKKFMSEAHNGCTITHWRPLPEPPKEDK